MGVSELKNNQTTKYIKTRMEVRQVRSGTFAFEGRVLDPEVVDELRHTFGSVSWGCTKVRCYSSSPIYLKPGDVVYCELVIDGAGSSGYHPVKNVVVISSDDYYKEKKLLMKVTGIGKVKSEAVIEEFKEKYKDGPAGLFLTKGSRIFETLTSIDEKSKTRLREYFEAHERIIQEQFLYKSMYLSGITYDDVTRIYGKINKETVYTLCKLNPYKINTDYNINIDSYALDRFATEFFDVEKNDRRRVNFFLFEILKNAAEDEGHLFLTKDELLQRTLNILELPKTELKNLDSMLQLYAQSGQIVVTEDDKVYLYKYKVIEDGIVDKLKVKVSQRLPQKSYEKVIDDSERSLGMQFSYSQREGIENSLLNTVSIITGGPGTGKTQVIKAIVDVYEREYGDLEVALLAPTGKAARRVSESTGRFSQTIHRYLGYDKSGNISSHGLRNQNHDLIIIDEFSMVSAELFYNLLESIDGGAKLILVGDENQIAPIGAGLILKDLIEAGSISHTKLKEIFRQQEGSKIVTFSGMVNKGSLIKDEIKTDKDPQGEFFIFNVKDSERTLYYMVREVSRRLNDGEALNDIQVLTPVKRGMLGALNINSIIQKNFNENVETGDFEYINNAERLYENDKVVQNVNNYKLGVMNGEIGYYIGKTNDEYIFNFSGTEVSYEKEDLQELNLAYALTVHKSQGSEFNTVIFVVNDTDYIVTNKAIVYTAWTRAKRRLYTIGDIEYLNERLDESNTVERNSSIKERLTA